MKTLKANWTVEFLPDLETQMGETLAEAMQAEIDREILWTLMCTTGWTRFSIPRFIDNHHAVDISYWLEEHCQGEYKRNGRDFLFKESKDATMFILKWGS